MKTILEEKINYVLFNSNAYKFRSIFFLIGSNAKNQISYLHYMWSKVSTQCNPHILWCYKNDVFSIKNINQKKKIKKKNKPPENFLSGSKIKYCYYNEINKLIGNTFGMGILENFEALSPNILAKIIETIEGGGIIIFILDTINSLDLLNSISMDIYKNLKNQAYKRITGRFIERFIFSLSRCSTCLVLDDNLNIISLLTEKSKKVSKLFEKSHRNSEFSKNIFFELIKNVKNMEPLSSLIEKTRTFDQARAFLSFMEAISNKSILTTVILTAPRGRGKSATLGLATAAAVAYGYGNIFVTAPNPENLNTFFAFVFVGLNVLNYQEDKHFEILYDSRYKFINKINIYCTHKQTITFIFPSEIEKIKDEIEMLIVDEAAAIPLQLLESICGSYVTLMSSTSSGYEGTGKSFGLKFIKKIKSKMSNNLNVGRKFFNVQSIKMEEPIRYSKNDPVEKWLNEFLCLDCHVSSILLNGCPNPNSCKLFLVDRNALFSQHKIAERFLQKIIGLLSTVHYKNSPDDLQMICDAPSHRILVLITALPLSIGFLPDILCVLHVSYEGQISRKFIEKKFLNSFRVNGDLIPWVLSKYFLDSSFAELSGIRIIRIAVHPDIQNMGYGTVTLKIFKRFFQNKVKKINFQEKKVMDDSKKFKNKIPVISPMLIDIESRYPPKLDYMGVSFGLTHSLFYFWKKNGYKLIFIRSEKNKMTGECICIMINPILIRKKILPVWIKNYQFEFLNKFVNTLNWKFKYLPTILVYDIIQNAQFESQPKKLQLKKIKKSLNFSDINKIYYCLENSVFDFKILFYLFPQIARILIWSNFLNKKLLKSEIILLIAVGLQQKTYDILFKEMNFRNEQIISSIKGIYIKLINYLHKTNN